MDRVSSANYQTIGGRRTWRNKNLGAGIVGTTFDQLWFAGVQENIIGPVEATGITPADATLGSQDLQLLQAIRRIAGGNANAGSVITASTATLTPDDAGLVLVDATAGNILITLPLSAAAGGQSLRYDFVRLDSTGHTVTFALSGSDTAFPVGSLSGSIPGPGALSVRGSGVSSWANLTSLTAGTAILHGQQTFATSGTFTPPAGVTTVYVDGAGGGGGGGYGDAGSNSGGGGGGGADWSIGYALTVVPLTPYTITIGARGTAVASADGTAGGSTSFGSLLTLVGGSGGAHGTGVGPAAGGAGGSGVGQGGSVGQAGIKWPEPLCIGGAGGGGGWGSGGAGGILANAGADGQGFGGGGGGGADGNMGGTGCLGFVRVWW